MFMHKASMELKEKLKKSEAEVKEKQTTIDFLQRKVTMHDWELEKRNTENALEVEKAKQDIRKDMQKSLIESDLLRATAVAKLEAYEKMDTKAEREHINKMLEKAIEGLSKEKVIVQKG